MVKAEEFKKKMCERKGEVYVPPGGLIGKLMKEKESPNRSRRTSSSSSPSSSSSSAPSYATVGEKVIPLHSLGDALSLCRTVELSRMSASHELNERSSRSHCLVTVHVGWSGEGGKYESECNMQ